MSVFLFRSARQDREWQPAADIYRTSWGWILKFDLAGVRMDDVHVHVSKRTVTVDGVRRDCAVEDGCRHYSMEITYSQFRRVIELPDNVDTADLRMDYRDGILYVRIRTKGEEQG